jgi:hypothetical protein
MISKQELIQLYLNGSTLKSLGEKYGVSKQRIHQVINDLDVHRNRIKREVNIDLEIIKEFRWLGLSWSEISKSTNIPIQDLYTKLDTKSLPLYGGTHKKCTVCQEVKPVTEFYPRKKGEKLLDSRCKKCNYESMVSYAKIRKGQK